MSTEPIGGLNIHVGKTTEPRKITLSEKEMADFAICVKATVGTTSHSNISSAVIPTVFTLFRQGEFQLMEDLGIHIKQVLHAEQEYAMCTPLLPGEEINFSTRLSSVVEKKSRTANLAFMAFETDFQRTADGIIVATARSTMVYRELLA